MMEAATLILYLLVLVVWIGSHVAFRLLLKHLGYRAPEKIFALGNLDILQTKPLALFCSRKCPGNLILQTYDLAQHWRDQGVTVIGGFHSPMEARMSEHPAAQPARRRHLPRSRPAPED